MSVKEQSELMLDGNAIGGVLGEIFAMEMTSAEGKCAGCGAVNAIGRVHVYMNAPGVVVRCPDCTAVLMRIVRGNGRCWIDLSGLRVLELADR
jgi:Zn finger protein HypA/HybF involved in hydrogenase expression